MATMDKASRIVRCPKCLALLQEPPPGTPLYKCGNCSTVLRAKHAASDGPGARRGSTRAQQPNRATSPGNADSIEGRKLLSKPMPHDLPSRQVNTDDSDDYRNRTGNPKFSPADTGKTSPGHLHHGYVPPGPTPPTHVRSMTNTYADNGSRTVQDHQRLVPRDLASPSREDDLLRRREALTYVLQTKGSSPAYVEEARSGKKSPNDMIHHIRSPLTDQMRNPSAICDARDEKEGFVDMRTRNAPANVTNEGANNGARERQRIPGAEDDGTTFSPTKALAALRMQNAGPLYKVKERQVPGQGATSKFSIRNSQGSLIRGRIRSQGDENTGTGNADIGLRHDAVEPGPSTVRNGEEMLGLHRRQRSDGAAFSERSPENDIYAGSPALNSGTRWSLEEEVKAVDKFLAEITPVLYVSEKERRALHSLKLSAGKEKSRDNPVSARGDGEKATPDQKSISRTSSSDIARQLNERRVGSPPKTITKEQDLSPASDVSLVRRIPPELKALQNEKVIVSKDTLDDEDKPGAGYSPSLSSRTRGKPMSPPRFLLSNSVIEGAQPQPEHMSKVQEPDSPSSLQVFHDLPDVLDYDTCEDSSNADDADQYQVVSKPHSEELKSPPYHHNGQLVQADVTGGSNGRLDDEDEQVPTDTMSMNRRSQPKLGVVSFTGPVKAGASSEISSHRPPESIHSKSAPQTQISDQRKQELQGTSTRPPDVLEAANSFSFGLGGLMQGQGYSSLKGRTQKIRLQINTALPERIHVRCRHCKLQLEVPPNLARSETGLQKLRCGSCWKTSRFRLNHLLSLSESSSPAGSDRSPESSFRLGSSDGTSGGYSGTRSNRETGSQDRAVIRTQSGANLPVPPSARHNPRAASGSKLSNVVSVSGVLSETSKASTPATSGDLDPAASSSPHGGKDLIVAVSPSGQGEPSHTSLSPTLSSTSQEVSSKYRQQKTTSPDRKILQSSSDSDEEKAFSTQLKIGPSAFVPARMTTWSAPETPDFDDGHEFKGLKGFLKKSVKELTKGKKSTQFRRKVVVNGHAVPDDVVRRAEEHAGGIHPGSYWYDFRAGFWGVMGGPCLGMIPPFIEELNFPLAQHCSHGKTGVSVNGRELHHKDLELLKKRGLPGTPGKSYNVDIDGRLTEETTGFEFKGLGRLAPTLEQTGRGPGMWVPENQRGS